MHLRIYSDSSLQNPHRNDLQISFLISLADAADNINTIHCHSSRGTKKPSSTEQAEILGWDKALYVSNATAARFSH